MPISKENQKLYPENWREISAIVRKRNDECCELCDAKNGLPHWKTGSKVVLTVHHIYENEKYIVNPNDKGLISVCQRCHLRLDFKKHMRKRKEKRDNKNQMSLL